MKRILMALAVAACTAFATPCYGGNNIVKGDPNALDSLSYCVGMGVGVTLKSDKTIAILDFNMVEFCNGFTDHLLGNMTISYNDAADKLMLFVSKTAPERLVAFGATRAENPNAVFNPFVSDTERNEISYAFGLFMAEEVEKPLSEIPFPIHCYWLSRAIQDVYANSLIMTEAQIMEFLGRAEIRLQQINNKTKNK